jgi:hypothetical protein
MNQTLRDAFARELDQAGRFDVDVEALVERGETRLRHRRLGALMGCVAAVALVLAVVAGVTAGHSVDRGDGPVDLPPHPAPTRTSARQIVYSDVRFTSKGVIGDGVHYGNHLVNTGNPFVHLDVTDDGFLYTARNAAVWFSSGGTPVQVGAHLCAADSNGEFSNFDNRSVITSNSGSLAAWFDCAQPDRPVLVVFDTDLGREVFRDSLEVCRGACELVDLTDRDLYLDRAVFAAGYPRPEYRFDLSSHRVRPTTRQEYADDLADSPRGLVVGDTWKSGNPTNGFNGAGQYFAVSGSRLVPLETHGRMTKAFDTATRHALHLHLPAGYPRGVKGGPFNAFPAVAISEWLDDDTLVIAAHDLLTCRISTGRCVVAAPWPHPNHPEMHRLLPGKPLPG